MLFLISQSEDGIRIKSYTKEALEKEVASWREYSPSYRPHFLQSIPIIKDGYWAEMCGVILIKGEIVVPQALVTVTEYDLANL